MRFSTSARSIVEIKAISGSGNGILQKVPAAEIEEASRELLVRGMALQA
jgi:hypothetical protein